MKKYIDRHFMKLWFTALGVAYVGAWLRHSGYQKIGMVIVLMSTGLILLAGFITRSKE